MTSDTSKTMLLILNPTAGRRRGGLVDAVVRCVRAEGWTVDVVETAAAGDARRLAERCDSARHALIAGAGGGGRFWAGGLGGGDRGGGAGGVVGDRPPQPPLCRALCRGACCRARRAVAACLPVRALGPRAHPALRARPAAGPPAAHRRLSRGLRPRGPCLGAERRRRGWPAAGANRWR